jgi:thiol-disulfide isomerase/thioredoxin
MAGSSKDPGQGNVPPRPGGKRPVPKRPAGKPPTGFVARPARQAPRASARQAIQARRQRNILFASGSAALVVVVVAIFVTAKLAGGNNNTNKHSKYPVHTFALTPAMVNQAEGVSLASIVKNAEAALTADHKSPKDPPVNAPYKINGSSLTLAGKPEMLYVGAEFCPFCAAERWSMVMALSQFGKLSGLRGVTSSATDVNASTPTFSFYNSSYSSNYMSFVPVEEETNVSTALQNPTAAQEALVAKWDVTPYTTQNGSIPFIYIDGKYIVTGLQYSQSTAARIAGDSFQAADAYLTSGANPTSQATEAAAGFLVGDMCTLTHNQPAKVCSAVPANLKGVNAASETKGVSAVSTTAPASSTTTAAKATTTAASSTTTAAKATTTAPAPTTTAQG